MDFQTIHWNGYPILIKLIITPIGECSGAMIFTRRLDGMLYFNIVRIALENHEYETADELVEVIKKVDSPWIGLHYDFGNAMMAWEDPVEAAKKMAPYTFTTHFKDHIVIPCPEDKYGYVVCGVPAGEGNIDLAECLRVMLDGSTLQRLNIEMCYPYCAQFKRTPGAGGVNPL